MKASSLILACALFVFFQSSDSRATGIYQLNYGYGFDNIAHDGAHGQTFVICDDVCVAGPYLAPALRLPALSVKVSTEAAVVGEGEQRGPQGGGRQTAVRKGTTDGERGQETPTNKISTGEATP